MEDVRWGWLRVSAAAQHVIEEEGSQSVSWRDQLRAPRRKLRAGTKELDAFVAALLVGTGKDHPGQVDGWSRTPPNPNLLGGSGLHFQGRVRDHNQRSQFLRHPKGDVIYAKQ